MAVTFGFYNSIDHDRVYNASHMSSIFNGIIKDGVFMSIGTALQVTPGTGLSIVVGVGRAWFNSTWTDNDSPLTLPVSLPDLVLPRIDTVVLEINATDEVRANSFKIIEGTPATNPVPPVLTNTSTIHQYPLANISVPIGITEFTPAYIVNKIGSSQCPYITGILSTINTDGLVAQWEQEFMDWFDEMKDQLSVDAAGNLQIQIDSKFDAVKVIDKNTTWGGAFGEPIISHSPPFDVKWQAGVDYTRGSPVGEVTVTFPEPFNGAPLIFLTAYNSLLNGNAVSVSLKQISETGFTAIAVTQLINTPYHQLSSLITVNWMAIGPK